MISSVLSAVFVILLPSLIAFACFKRGVAVGYKAVYKAGYKAHEEDAYQRAALMRENEALLAYRCEMEHRHEAFRRAWARENLRRSLFE